MMAMTIFMGFIPLEARSEEDRLGGRNSAPRATARGCCRGVLIKPHANQEFAVQRIGIMEVFVGDCDRLPHVTRIRAQEPVRNA